MHWELRSVDRQDPLSRGPAAFGHSRIRGGRNRIEKLHGAEIPWRSESAAGPREVRLAPRQARLVELLLEGAGNAEIGREMRIAVRTVKAHLNTLFAKFRIYGGGKRVRLAMALYRKPPGVGPTGVSYAALTTRQRQVTELVSLGLSNGEIGAQLGIAPGVVKNHLRSIYDKIGVWNRLELSLWHAARTGHNGRMP